MYSPESYARLLRAIRDEGYRSVGFDTLDPESAERQVIVRHDVDFIPRLAEVMGRIDADHGIANTTFVLARSHAYNLFSPTNQRVLEAIVKQGHAVGVHCAMPSPAPATKEALIALVQDDFALGRHAFPGTIPAFAWHTAPAGFHDRWGNLAVPGLVNAYDDRYVRRIAFFSDSNARHTPAALEALFRGGAHPKVQLLLHPIIWMCGGGTMMEVWSNAYREFVREIEVEVSTNATYQRRLPSGLSADALSHLAAAVLAEAGAEDGARRG